MSRRWSSITESTVKCLAAPSGGRGRGRPGAFALLLMLALAVAGPARAGASQFIDGYFVKGANLPWLDGAYAHDLGTNQDPNYAGDTCSFNSADMMTALVNLHQMGITVVRVWLNEEGQGLILDGSGKVTGVQPVFLTNLDTTVNWAASNNIALYLTFNNSYDDSFAGNCVLNSAVQSSYIANGITAIVARYKGNPHIFGFDLMNEIDSMSPVAYNTASWAQIQSYVRAAVSAIHGADPSRLASCSVGWGPAWVQLSYLTGLGLDFYDFHDYEDVPQNADSWYGIPFPTAASLNLDKPVLIGECGQSTATRSTSIQETCVTDYLNIAKNNNLAGALIWSYGVAVYPVTDDYRSMTDPITGVELPVCGVVQNWNYGPAPSISSFTPASGLAGTTVTINGANFTGATVVAFNGLSAASYSVVSASQITATVPAGATTGPITVTTPDAPVSSAANFQIIPPYPVIFGFSPTMDPAGRVIFNGSQVRVQLWGTNFLGAKSVAFNGVVTTNLSVYLGTQIQSPRIVADEIFATLPTNATTGLITVTAASGSGESTNNFVIYNVPPAAQALYSSGLVSPLANISASQFNLFMRGSTTYNVSNTTPVAPGSTLSISLNYNAGENDDFLLWLSPEFSTLPFGSLDFWINGGATGVQGLSVSGAEELFNLESYALPAIPANTWTHCIIPLTALGDADLLDCDGFNFNCDSPTAGTYYLDAIQLDAAGVSSTLTPQAVIHHADGTSSFNLTVSGFIGQSYLIQTSTNLLTWANASTNTLTSGSDLTISNVIPLTINHQYWRAVALP